VATDGKVDREAMEEAMDALGSDLSIRLSRREETPMPSSAQGGERIPSHENYHSELKKIVVPRRSRLYIPSR
jgi:hypothetical protein